MKILDIPLIDSMIRQWRDKRDNATIPRDELIAECHVEAYQSVRLLHGLPMLPFVTKPRE